VALTEAADAAAFVRRRLGARRVSWAAFPPPAAVSISRSPGFVALLAVFCFALFKDAADVDAAAPLSELFSDEPVTAGLHIVLHLASPQLH